MADNETGMLSKALPAVDEPDGQWVPAGLPDIVDAHVHIFPDPVFQAVWSWFDRYGWPIRYRLPAEKVVPFLIGHGIRHVIALHYAHKAGVARGLNQFMARICSGSRAVTGLATVFPGENEMTAILEEAFELGLAGVKLHAHVQCFEMDSASMEEVYACCEANDRPLLMHVGREPKSPAYACDPHRICGADRLERVLQRHPRLRICVPHLGADEFSAYQRLLANYDNLWLDTTMVLAGYLPGAQPPCLDVYRSDRLMYGSDFPNIPYGWDRELRRIAELGLPEDTLRRLLSGNAVEFFRF